MDVNKINVDIDGKKEWYGMGIFKFIYWYIYTFIFDKREEKVYECPTCHWDSTNDDEMENATTSGFEGGFYDWSCTAHWACPRCGTKFDTWESN